ncbi:MAG: M14 family zinc carboxypeptidase [Bdellovibrio sp.]
MTNTSMFKKTILSFVVFGSFSVSARERQPQTSVASLPELCESSLKVYGEKGKGDPKLLKAACSKVQVLNDGCKSVNGVPLFHYDRRGNHRAQQKILVFSLIHGDEVPAGMVGRFWMERLQGIDPRNSWRVIPILNPDGVKARTRTNANKVDINRNFPTLDWDKEARAYWQKTSNKNPRRNPGVKSASEPETRCAMDHIEDFKPDFVVSVHTPLKVLDFDGPRLKPPKFDYLPWKTLGNYPGSLGRYLWLERNTPVLTAEFKEDEPPEKSLVQLQDIIGFLVSLEINGRAPSATDLPKQIK